MKFYLAVLALALSTISPAYASNPEPWHLNLVSFTPGAGCDNASVVVRLVDANGNGVKGKPIVFDAFAEDGQYDQEYAFSASTGGAANYGKAGGYIHFPNDMHGVTGVDLQFYHGHRDGTYLSPFAAGFLFYYTDCP